MRTLQYMLDNADKLPVENKWEAQKERYYRSERPCKYGHPPVRDVSNGQCSICAIETRKKYNDITNEREKAIRSARIMEEKRKKEEYIRLLSVIEEERKKAESLQKCTKLDEIKTGVLFFVKGRCAV